MGVLAVRNSLKLHVSPFSGRSFIFGLTLVEGLSRDRAWSTVWSEEWCLPCMPKGGMLLKVQSYNMRQTSKDNYLFSNTFWKCFRIKCRDRKEQTMSPAAKERRHGPSVRVCYSNCFRASNMKGLTHPEYMHIKNWYSVRGSSGAPPDPCPHQRTWQDKCIPQIHTKVWTFS